MGAKKSRGWMLLGGVSLLGLIALVMVVVLSIMAAEDQTAGSSHDYTDGSNQSCMYAYDQVKMIVQKRLRYPNSAEFPEERDRYQHVEHLGGERYGVDSWVYALNNYGVKIRHNFSAVISVSKDGRKVELESIKEKEID